MFEGTTAGLQPVQVFLMNTEGHQWDWTALVVAGVQSAVLTWGIWLVHRASTERGVQVGQQSAQLRQQWEQLRQQSVDSERRHEQAMTALHALIERMNPRPPDATARTQA